MILKKLYFLTFISTSVLMLSSCGGEKQEKQVIDQEVFDPESSLNTVFDGKIFSIPSPVHTALLIKDLSIDFDKNIINNHENASKYAEEFQQAINLGIYGCDLGYVSIYSQKKEALTTLNAINAISDKLGINSAFDADFMKRFEDNSTDEDSMIYLMADAFKRADNYLKENKRKEISALILTGGWIESMYVATNINAAKQDSLINKRICEQKQTLETIVQVLNENNVADANTELISELEDLKDTYDKIVFNYTYEAPETDKEQKLTVFHHTIEIIYSDKLMAEIKNKIEAIRNNLID